MFDDHRNTNQDALSEHVTSLEGFDLPELSSRYGLELDISSLGLAVQLGAETQTLLNLPPSVDNRVDRLAIVVNSEFTELKQRYIALEKSASENRILLKKKNEKLIEIVLQLGSSTVQYKEDLAAVRQLLGEQAAYNTSISILLETLVQRLLN